MSLSFTAGRFQALTAAGVPIVGGQLFSYASGTTTPQATYTDATLGTPNTNPIVLNSRGEAQVWLGTLPYTFLLKDSLGSTIWSIDGISDPATLVAALSASLAGVSGSSLIGYKQAGAGAVTRTAQDKLRETVSITDYGADPTGVADSMAAINAAFAASHSVFVPAGTYTTTASITIPDNTRFFGAGREASTVTCTAVTDVDGFVFGWFVNIESMTIARSGASSGSKGCMRGQSLTNSNIPTNVGGNNWRDPSIGGLCYKNTLRDLTITGGQNYALDLVNPGYVDLINIRCILSLGPAANLHIAGNAAPYGNLPQGTTVNIIGGEFTGSFGGPGISANYLFNSVFTNVKCEGNYGRGILLTNCGQLKLTSPYVENNFALGASLGDGDIVVTSGNQIHIDTPQIVSNHAAAAIATSGCTNCSLTNYQAALVGGSPATLSLDSGWGVSLNSLGITAQGIDGPSGGRWVKFADGTATFTKKITLTAIAIATASGNVFVQAAAQADTVFPAIFMSDGAGGSIFSPAITVMSDSAVLVWPISGGASKVNNAIRYRLASTTSQASVTVDVYITLTGRWQ